MPVVTPKTRGNIQALFRTTPIGPQNLLLVGQQTIGTATSGILSEVPTKDSINGLFGGDSYIATTLRRVFDTGFSSNVFAIGLDDNGSSVAAASTVTITGLATDNGSITVTAGNVDDGTIQIGVAVGDDATTIAAAIVAEWTAKKVDYPIIAASTLGVVTFTFVNSGIIGNDQYVSVDTQVGGVVGVVTAFSGGTLFPDTTTIFDTLTLRFQGIGYQDGLSITPVQDFLEERLNEDNEIKDGIAVTSRIDTEANLITLAEGINSSIITVLGYSIQLPAETSFAAGTYSRDFNDSQGAEFLAIRALRLTDGADITPFTINPLFSEGGITTASLPYHNSLLLQSPVPTEGTDWLINQVTNLNDNGITVFGSNVSNTQTIVGDVVTTLLFTPIGDRLQDIAFLNILDTSSVVREFRVTRYRQEYAQAKLTAGISTAVGVVTVVIVKAFDDRLFADLANEGLWEANIITYRKGRTIVIDEFEGTITVSITPDLIRQVRGIDLFTTIVI